MKFIANKMGVTIQLANKYFDIGMHCRQYFGVKNTIGVRNNCYDGKRVIFLDYDDTLLEEMLIPEIKYLQKKYKLGEFYILKSSQKKNAYHAICIDKLTARRWMRVLNEAGCDQNYKLVPLIQDHKAWVLRISTKGSSDAPKHILTIPSKHNNNPKSLVHAKFLNFHYDIYINHLKNLDESKDLLFIEYSTINFIRG